MGFVAKQAVSRLDYDFTGLGVPDLDGVKGTSPEPSQEQVRVFQEALRRVYKIGEFAEDEASADGSNEQLVRRVQESLTIDEARDRDTELSEIYAAVCSEEPSAKEIMALPARVRIAYIGYLSQELLTPTAGSSVTKRSLAPVKNA